MKKLTEDTIQLVVEHLFPKQYHCLLDFKTDGDQSDLAMDEAAVQKRLWMIQVSEQCAFKNGLDLFAGVGYGTFIMSQCCENILALENDKKKFPLLYENLLGTGIHIWQKDNLEFLQEQGNIKYDYIDFDPFSNANKQLEFLDHVFDDGLVWITSGEIQTIYRNLPNVPEFAKETAEKYKGKFAVNWPEQVYFPYIKERFNLNLIDFYVYPTSVRSLWTRNMYKNNKIKLTGQRYIGWFRDLKKPSLI